MAGQNNMPMVVVVTAAVIIGSITICYPSQLQAAFAQNSSNITSPVNNSNMSSIPIAFPPETIQYNVTYSEWTAKWWQWLSSVPADRNPAADETGANCHEGQNGPVWFLAGTYGGLNERVCSIPAGKSILFPVVNQLCSFLDRPNLRTESELRSCAVAANEGVTELMVTIDGQQISEQQLRTYRVQSPLIELNLPEGNILSGQQGSTQAVSDGFWVFLPPLAPGAHEIHFRGTIVDFTTVSQNNFVSEALYHITVVG
jgi:hypothetical protein